MRILPVVYQYRKLQVVDEEGELTTLRAWVPLARYANLSDRQYAEDEERVLVPLEARSRSSHNHFFAALNSGFESLPEGDGLADIAGRLNLKLKVPPAGFVDSEHFRKWALCESGFCKSMEFNFATKQEAMRLARFYREEDAFAYIGVAGTHVTIKVAASQSAAAMAKQEFEDSKRAVLDLLESMIGVKKGTLVKEAGKSA